MRKDFFLIALSVLALSACSTPIHFKEKSHFINWVQSETSVRVCNDFTISQCTGGDTSSRCVSELEQYEPECTKSSFSTNSGPVLDQDLYEYGIYTGCIVKLYFEAHEVEKSDEPKCQNIYKNAIEAYEYKSGK